jgi:nucleoside-diphosphate-sugar epimerase
MNKKGIDLKIGITGSTGVLGSRLTQYLADKGYSITCFVRPASNIKKINLLKAKFVYGDLQDFCSLKEFISDIDVCIHLAAQVEYAAKSTYHKVNVVGTENLCKAVVRFNPSCKLVFCSTIASLRFHKWFKFLNTAYAASKYQAEKVIDHYKKTRGLHSVIIYSGMIYGPHDIKFVPALIKNLQAEKIFLISGGEKRAPLIYIDDLCELFRLASINKESVAKKYLGVQKLDMGIHDFIRILAKKIKCKLPTKTIPKLFILPSAIFLEGIYNLLKLKKAPQISKRVIDVLSINLNFEKYKLDDEINWQPTTDINVGLDNALGWYYKYLN